MAISAYLENYYDDINTPGADGKTPIDKNYLRILFKPGYSVQTRELNQLQSALQAQLDSVGLGIFRGGKPVLNGRVTFDAPSVVYAIDIRTLNGLPIADDILNRISYVNNDGGQFSKVVSYKQLNIDQNGQQPYRFYIKNISSETDTGGTNLSKYAVGENVFFFASDGEEGGNSDAIVENAEVFNVANAVGANIESGVYFINGCFVHATDEYAVADVDGSGIFNGAAILKVTENLIGATSDVTLYDNAQGSPNFAEPGADRYQILTELQILDEAALSTVSYSYIRLLDIQGNAVMRDSSDDTFAGLDDKLAQRTYEESGNYEVNPFPIHLREAYRDPATNNGGLLNTPEELAAYGYTGDSAVDDAKADLFAQLDPSVAYVNGYRIELRDSVNLKLDKARTTRTKSDAISADIGNYVDGYFSVGSGLPVLTNPATVYTMYDSGGYGEVGTCKIYSIEARPGDGYRIFLYDVTFAEGKKSSDIATIEAASEVSGYGRFDFTVTGDRSDISKNKLLFDLPYTPISRIENLKAWQIKTVSLSSDGSGTLVYMAPDDIIVDKNPLNIIVYKIGTGAYANPTVATGTPVNNLTLTGLEPDTAYRIYLSQFAAGRLGRKGLTTITETPVSLGGNLYSLSCRHVVSVATSGYELISSGQGDVSYTNAIVQYTPGGTAPPITYDGYEFGVIAGPGEGSVYYSYESYFDDRLSPPRKMLYDEIPSYDDVDLSSVLDFRFLSSAVSLQPLDPYNAITFDLTSYLPRIDTIFVNSSGKFFVKSGQPDIVPVAPQTPKDSMALYNIELNGYTLSPSDTLISKVDNKRYTMSAIRKLDRRISNLEYYTTLSLLEKDAKDQSIYDDELDRERFKNGFIVDNFTGHQVGDPSNPEYACAVDPASNSARPAFTLRSLKLDPLNVSAIAANGEYTHSGLHDKIVTLPYKDVPYIDQSIATSYISVNPFEFGAVVGNLELFPASDHWVDINQRPDVTISDTAAYDAFLNIAASPEVDILGTEWGSWETVWEGRPIQTGNRRTTTVFWARNNRRRTFEQDIIEAREGVTTSLDIRQETRDLGNNVLSVEVRPYIRSRYVYFKAKGVKPNTRYYSYFDGVDVSQNVYGLAEDYFENNKDSDIASINGTALPALTSLVDGSLISSELRSSASGEVYGLFIIPDAASGVRFPTGSRNFRITDSARNNTTETQSYAQAVYSAVGTLEEKQRTIISTAIPELVRTPVRETATRRVPVRWSDPIAQSFLISNPEGVFVTSLDLYFQNRATDPTLNGVAAPVQISIVTCENGIPTQNIVPFTTVSKNATDVNISEDGSSATEFRFSQPAYLMPNEEYAIVVTSADSSYTAWICRVGEKDVRSGQPVLKNPYMGVFFTSQNSSTWTPEQSADLKFKLNRAEFPASEFPRTVTFETSGIGVVDSIAVTNPGSGYSAAPSVIFTNPAGAVPPTLAAGARAILNDSGGIDRVELLPQIYNGKIVVGGVGYVSTPNISFSGGGGGGATAVAVMNDFGVSNFYLKQDNILLSATDEENPDRVIRTDVANTLTLLSQSYDVDPGTLYEASLSKRTFTDSGVNANERVICSSDLYTSNSYLSPVIDLERLSVKLIKNYVTLDTEATSKYITRRIPLAAPADKLSIYFDVNRPSPDCNITVKVRFKSEAVDAPYEWVEVLPKYPRAIPINSNREVYSEMQYEIDPPEGQDFTEFAVMLIFTSANIVDVPTVKRLRAIATV